MSLGSTARSVLRTTAYAALFGFLLSSCPETSASAQSVEQTLSPQKLQKISTVDERFQSYNVEAVEVTGGRFWKPYDTAKNGGSTQQRDRAPMFSGAAANMFTQKPPIDLTNRRLRTLAKALGPAYLRMSGSWQNATYFHDSDAPAPAVPPAGFNGVMTRAQLKGVIDFARDSNADFMTSFATSMGTRDEKGVWTSEQATRFNDYIRSFGGKIAATEFMNEPTLATMSGVPKGYGPTEYARDAKLFRAWLKQASPGTLFVGPGGEGEGMGWHQPEAMHRIPSEELLKASGPIYDVYSFHFYSAISERCSKMLGGGVTASEALLPSWFQIPDKVYAFYAGFRDRYEPGKPIWVTETGEAACGGDRFASTYLDTFRYLNELGALAKHGVQVVAHNTLAETDYALIDGDTFSPRPDYWGALLWRRFMGTTVLDAGPPQNKNVYVYAHCARGIDGAVSTLVLNPSPDVVNIKGEGPSEVYQLTAKELQATEVFLNGTPLQMTASDELPRLMPVKSSSVVKLRPFSIAFLIYTKAANPACRVEV